MLKFVNDSTRGVIWLSGNASGGGVWQNGWTGEKRGQKSLSKLNADVLKLVGTLKAVSKERATMEADGTLTAEGVRRAIAQQVTKVVAPPLARVDMGVARVNAAITTGLAEIRGSKIDPTDIAGAMLRAEIRAHFRSLSPNLRMGLAMGTEDKDVLAALLEGPEFLVGLPSDQMAKIADRALRLQNAEAVAVLEEMQDAVAVATALVTDCHGAAAEIMKLAAKDAAAALAEAGAAERRTMQLEDKAGDDDISDITRLLTGRSEKALSDLSQALADRTKVEADRKFDMALANIDRQFDALIPRTGRANTDLAQAA